MAKKYKLKVKNDKNAKLKMKIAYYLNLGLDLNEAGKLADISTGTMNLLRCDFEFEEFVQKCLAENKSIHLENIQKAGKDGYWQASAWYLERKFPNEFGKRDLVRNEYIIKVQTLQSTLIKILNDELKDYPQLKYRIVNAIRNYEYSGETAMDHSFHPKQLEHQIVDVGDNI